MHATSRASVRPHTVLATMGWTRRWLLGISVTLVLTLLSIATAEIAWAAADEPEEASEPAGEDVAEPQNAGEADEAESGLPPEALEGIPAGAVFRAAGPQFREWTNPDGTATRQMYPGPVFFEKAPGVWVPIKLDLVKPSGSTSYVPTQAAPGLVAFAPTAVPGQPMVTMSGNGATEVRYPELVASTEAPAISGRTITYPKALSGGRDLKLTATTVGFEEALVLHSAVAPRASLTEFRVPLGVTARQAGPGVEFVTLDGKVVATFGGGLAFDSATPVPSEVPVTVTLKTMTPTSVVTETSVDPAWLAGGRVFPVTIDPTFAGPKGDSCPSTGSTYSGCETYTNSDNLDGNSGTGYWANSELRLGSSGAWQEGTTSTLSDTRTFVKFPTDNLGSPGFRYEVTQAWLSMYAYDARGNTSAKYYRAYTSFGDPNKNTVWNTQPSFGSPMDEQALAGTGSILWGVTTAVQEWFNGSRVNRGFALRSSVRETASFRQFYSWNSGQSSSPSLSVTYLYNYPSAPTNVWATAGTNTASVTWSPPSDTGGDTISGYKVETYENGVLQRTSTFGSSARAHTDNLVDNGDDVYFRVYATNSRGYGAAGQSNNVVPMGQPSAPTGVGASAGNQQATVTWSPPTDDGGGSITGYDIEVYRGSGSFISGHAVGSLARSYTKSGLTNGEAVYFRVFAKNSGFKGTAYGQSPQVTPVGPPSAPRNVQAQPGNATASVTWDAPIDSGGTPVTGYVAEVRKADNSFVGSEPLPATARSYEKTGLTNGTTYYFRIFANNAAGQSPEGLSNSMTPVAPPDPRPMIPTLLNPQAAYTFPTEEIPQRFSVVTKDLQGHRYQAYVELKADNGAAVHSTVTMPPADSDQPTEGQASVPLLEGRYQWRARACDIPEDNCSEWSNWRGFQVGAPLRASSGSDAIGLEDFYAYERWQTGAGTAYLNTATGNLVLQETDLEVPGPINLRLSRTYNAVRDQHGGPLGRGWTLGIAEGEGLADSLLDAVLSLDLQRMVRIVGNEDTFEIFDGDGTTHHFARGGLAGPGWHSPPGVNLVLTDGQDGSVNRWYHATRSDGVRYEFRMLDGAQRLDRIVDRLGNVLQFTYSGGKITQISDGAARTLTFTWFGDHVTGIRYTAAGQHHDIVYTVNDTTARLTGVTQASGTPDARTRAFAYNDAGLASVTDAKGATTSFAIGLESRRLTAVTDRGGNVWPVGYDGECSRPTAPGTSTVCVTVPGAAIGAAPAQRTWAVQSTTGNPVSYTDEGDKDEAGNDRRNTRSFTWAANRLARTADEAGNVTEFTYNELGQIDGQVFTGAGEQPVVTDLEYEVAAGVGDLKAAREGVGTQEERAYRFTYDHTKGLLLSVTDPNGKVTTMAYHGNGRIKSVTDPRGHTTRFGDPAAPDVGYHFTSQPLAVTDARGETMTFAYDFLGRLTQRVDRNGQPWSQTWDARGNLRSTTNPLGHVTTFCYDGNNNKVLEVRPKAASHACGQSATTPYVTVFTYDTKDQLQFTKTTSDGQRRVVEHRYRPDGHRDASLMPRSFDAATGDPLPTAQWQRISYEYYPNGRLAAFIDPEGNRSDLVYTPNNLLRRVTEPPNGSGATAVRRTVVKSYNGRGQETQVTISGEGGSTRHEYNAVGDRVATTSPKGQRTRYAYDKAGRLTATTDARGKITDRFYDAAGNLLRVRLPSDIAGSIVATYTYTERNEIASEVDASDPDHLITYGYDAEGRQLLRHDVNGGVTTRTVEQTWNGDGTLAERSGSLPGTTVGLHRSTFAYDANGNPISMKTYLDGATTPNVSDITVDHTSMDEPKTWTETLFLPSGPGVTKTSTFAYERDGALASRVMDGLATSYQHLRNGLEASTTGWSGVGAVSSTWNPNGTLATQTLPNGAVTAMGYDAASRIASKVVSRAGTSLSAWQQVVYDANGNRTGEVVSQLQPDGTMKTGNGSYTYDVVDRLVKAKHPFDTSAHTFALDEGGNILTDGENTYAYNKNRITKMQPATEPEDWPTEVLGPFPAAEFRTEFSYDKHGNMTKAVMPGQGNDTTSYTYDAAMHPRRTTEPDGSWVEYAYDALDRAVRRQESGGDVRLLFNDGPNDQVALETNAAGVAKTRYVLDSAGRPVGQQQVGAVGLGWFVTDLRNNLTQILNASGAVKSVYGYDPFGKEKAAHSASTDGFSSRLRFQMAPVDEKTGTYNLGPRLYDPGVNRFLSADHYVGAAANMDLQLDPLTGNRYLYAGANPIGLIDDGHGWFDWARNAYNRVRGLITGLVVSLVCLSPAALVCTMMSVAYFAIQTYMSYRQHGFSTQFARDVMWNTLTTLVFGLMPAGWSYYSKRTVLTWTQNFLMRAFAGGFGAACSAMRSCVTTPR